VKGYCSQQKVGSNTKTGPRPARAYCAPCAGRNAARSRKWPVSPLALSASRASGRNLGLGRESRVLPGPRLGPLDVSRPSASYAHARIPAEQNRIRRPCANPRVHLRLLAPRRAPQLTPRRRRRGPSRRRRAAPRQSRTRVDLGGRTHRSWRVSSPQPLAAARDLPTRRVDPSTAGGSGHGIFTKGESHNLLLHLKI
jgi:hypothetical protein